jgi:hypothetical protein
MADEKPKMSRGKGCLIALGVIFGLGFIGAFIAPKSQSGSPDQNTSGAEAALAQRAEEDQTLLYKAQAVVRQGLKDPDSADFSGGFAHMKHGEHAACGYVNAKNSFGAMAGASQWLVVPGKDLALVRSFDNERHFISLWNTYCAGHDDRDKPVPAEMFGVKLGTHPPSKLKPYDANRQVFVYASGKPTVFLGVPLQDVYFEADHGKLIGGSATAKGANAYDRWKAALLAKYGAPSSDDNGDRGIMEWKHGGKEAEAQLSYNATTNQTLLQIGYPAE